MTEEQNLRSKIIDVFYELKLQNFDIGIPELIDVIKVAEEDGDTVTRDRMQEVMSLLWCTNNNQRFLLQSCQAMTKFDAPKDAVTTPNAPEIEVPSTPRSAVPEFAKNRSRVPSQPVKSNAPLEKVSARKVTEETFRSLPLRVPDIQIRLASTSLTAYHPVSKRYMAYTWRYLRRYIADGPPDVLDLAATIKYVTETGLFAGPIYRRRNVNHSRLHLLIDHGGSMVPFHRYIDDLIATAYENTEIEEINTYYYRNVIDDHLFGDTYMMDIKTTFMDWFDTIETDDSILIVSDAGAARGYYNNLRVRKTLRFLRRLKKKCNTIAWLNPVPNYPTKRWFGTSAEVIAEAVPMFQMDEDGFSNAVDVLSGKASAYVLET